MTWFRPALSVLILFTLVRAGGPPARADGPARPAPAALFDPARHMRVSEVRPGMTGYGLSVFKGTAIERFDVKVLSILRNFNPKYDVVLVECKGANLEHTGSIAGMSGSPIYLTDESGRSRLIGAFAYGWPMMKDPVAGVQPIEYMLSLQGPAAADPPRPAGAGANAGAAGQPGASSKARAHWSIADVLPLSSLSSPSDPGRPSPAASPLLTGDNVFAPAPRLGGDLPRLQPLATPLMTSGVPSRVLASLAPAFAAARLVPMEAGGSGGQGTPPAAPVQLEPGSVLAIPLVTGDVEMAAVGTVTEVLGDRVFGFGHAFNNEGPVALPMGSGQISAIIANLNTSFKIGSLSQIRGTLLADQTVGVAGRVGAAPPMVPMELKVVYADGSEAQTYRFKLASHPKITPLVAASAVGAALSGAKELPQYHTLDYDLELSFANGQTVNLANSVVNAGPPELFQEIGVPISLAADNPFERVMLTSLRGTITVTPEAREAHLLSVSVPRLKYEPGATAKVFVTYRPFRGAEAILPIEFDIPRELPDGAYQFAISDWQTYLEAEKSARPFRFTADSVGEVFAAMKDVLALRHNAVYLQLLRKSDGIAIGRTALPHLPSSRRQVLLGSGSSDITAFVSSTVKVVPTDLVMSGSANFQLTVDRSAKVDPGKPAKPAAAAKAPEAKDAGKKAEK